MIELSNSCQLLLQMATGTIKSYFQEGWNIFDQVMYLLLAIAVVFRFAVTDDDFMAARYVYALDLIMFYLRILQLYYFHKHLGPKVVVIWRMVSLCVNVGENGRRRNLVMLRL